MNWYKIANKNLKETLDNCSKEERKKYKSLLNSLGFDENGNELEIHDNRSEEEKKKTRDEWREQEYEHMPA
jgi:hypothetical protein